MDIAALMKALETNAAKTREVLPVDVPGIGKLHVRRRTILEFEKTKDVALEPGDDVGAFARGLATLLCNEQGERYPEDMVESIAELLAKQPQAVFQQLVNVADGASKKELAEGNSVSTKSS